MVARGKDFASNPNGSVQHVGMVVAETREPNDAISNVKQFKEEREPPPKRIESRSRFSRLSPKNLVKGLKEKNRTKDFNVKSRHPSKVELAGSGKKVVDGTSAPRTTTPISQLSAGRANNVVDPEPSVYNIQLTPITLSGLIVTPSTKLQLKNRKKVAEVCDSAYIKVISITPAGKAHDPVAKSLPAFSSVDLSGSKISHTISWAKESPLVCSVYGSVDEDEKLRKPVTLELDIGIITDDKRNSLGTALLRIESGRVIGQHQNLRLQVHQKKRKTFSKHAQYSLNPLALLSLRYDVKEAASLKKTVPNLLSFMETFEVSEPVQTMDTYPYSLGPAGLFCLDQRVAIYTESGSLMDSVKDGDANILGMPCGCQNDTKVEVAASSLADPLPSLDGSLISQVQSSMSANSVTSPSSSPWRTLPTVKEITVKQKEQVKRPMSEPIVSWFSLLDTEERDRPTQSEHLEFAKTDEKSIDGPSSKTNQVCEVNAAIREEEPTSEYDASNNQTTEPVRNIMESSLPPETTQRIGGRDETDSPRGKGLFSFRRGEKGNNTDKDVSVNVEHSHPESPNSKAEKEIKPGWFSCFDCTPAENPEPSPAATFDKGEHELTSALVSKSRGARSDEIYKKSMKPSEEGPAKNDEKATSTEASKARPLSPKNFARLLAGRQKNKERRLEARDMSSPNQATSAILTQGSKRGECPPTNETSQKKLPNQEESPKNKRSLRPPSPKKLFKQGMHKLKLKTSITDKVDTATAVHANKLSEEVPPVQEVLTSTSTTESDKSKDSGVADDQPMKTGSMGSSPMWYLCFGGGEQESVASWQDTGNFFSWAMEPMPSGVSEDTFQTNGLYTVATINSTGSTKIVSLSRKEMAKLAQMLNITPKELEAKLRENKDGKPFPLQPVARGEQ